MKHLSLFSVLLLAVIFSASAQQPEVNRPQTSANVGMAPIQQGNWIVGGSLGSLGYSFEGESFNINLNPRAGYFVSDGLAVGLGANVGLATSPDADNVWTYGVAPFVRYYFGQGSSATGRFFGQGEVGIAGSSIGSGADLAFGIGAGYAHFITQSVALEAMVGYNYSKATVANANAQSGLGVSLGFQIYLPGQR
ncbi:hypothetical protein [Parapedobacter lycopersici]|uniref:hypothetical protein n=1 Tax=Parapedobacter lycopersici TaxID=1864939 RepID=UPI00214D49CE|nr:hypothetical protein [Parapedobacter lycopersici]